MRLKMPIPLAQDDCFSSFGCSWGLERVGLVPKEASDGKNCGKKQRHGPRSLAVETEVSFLTCCKSPETHRRLVSPQGDPLRLMSCLIARSNPIWVLYCLEVGVCDWQPCGSNSSIPFGIAPPFGARPLHMSLGYFQRT